MAQGQEQGQVWLGVQVEWRAQGGWLAELREWEQVLPQESEVALGLEAR